MSRFCYTAWTLAGLLFLGGCFSIKDQQTISPATPSPAAVKNTLQQKKDRFQKSQAAAFTLPDALGGVIASDRWVIYKDKEEEEFEGHVSYDNGAYVFRAQYALSQRRQSRISARGDVLVRKNEPDHSFYELQADKAHYNYKTGQGYAEAARGKTVQLVYKTSKGISLTATAQKATFNTREEWYRLEGQTVLTYTNEQGQTSVLRARRATVRVPQQHLLLEGGAKAKTGDYTLVSDTIVYNGELHTAAASGGRPLVQGTTPDGTFAIIADRAETDTDTQKIKLSGRVQGWTVSEQLNASKANQHF